VQQLTQQDSLSPTGILSTQTNMTHYVPKELATDDPKYAELFPEHFKQLQQEKKL
jgi:hypothetical protein